MLNAKGIKTIMVEALKVNTLKGHLEKLTEGETLHLITQKRINPYTFVLEQIEKHGGIEELIITTYRISQKALLTLRKLKADKKIKNLTIMLNDNYMTLMRNNANLVHEMKKNGEAEFIFANSHAKITLIKANNEFSVITGSGNYSDNPKIEQYILTKSKELYKFYKEFIEGEKWQDQ